LGINSPTDRRCLKLNWEAYEKIGAPEIKDVWHLIDVMEEMVAAQPEVDGEKTWGTCITSGSDGNSFRSMQGFNYWHGYGVEYLPYLLEADYINEKVYSILEDDSLYHEGLKWYNEVYRRGLLDPDSISAERATMLEKTESGMVMVPSANFLGPSPIYLEYLLPGTNIITVSSHPKGGTNLLIAINADTEHLEECLAYLDIISNPDDVMSLVYGGDGDGIWYSDGNVLRLTDRFVEYVKEKGTTTGYLFDSGEEYSLYNTSKFIHNGNPISLTTEDGDPVPNSLHYSKAYQSIIMGPTFSAWQETMGYNDWIELLEDKNALCEESFLFDLTSYFEVMDEKMKLTMDSIKDTVVNASWQMVYAESEAEFDKIWTKMVSDCEGLGAQELIDWALKNIENLSK